MMRPPGTDNEERACRMVGLVCLSLAIGWILCLWATEVLR